MEHPFVWGWPGLSVGEYPYVRAVSVRLAPTRSPSKQRARNKSTVKTYKTQSKHKEHCQNKREILELELELIKLVNPCNIIEDI